MTHSGWSDFLTQQGLTLDADAHELSQQPATLLMPLTDQAIISMEGPDSEKFLQGQLSCDLEQLNPQLSLLGANCTPKGMVIGAFRLLQRAPGSILLRLPQSVADAAVANLKKYSVFSKTDINRVDEQWVGLGLIGAEAEAVLSKLQIPVPSQVNQQVQTERLIAVRVAGNLPRFEIWCPIEHAQNIWQQLADSCSLASSKQWQAAEIEAGLVQLDPDSIESYIPQMLNLQAVDGISFNKGCYTGQEVVARLQFRGKLKKLMYSATVVRDDNLSQAPVPGTTLYNSAGRSVGKVLSCVPQQQTILLQAVINKSAADNGDLHLHSAAGAAVTIQPLPYEIDPELFQRPER